jgi:HAE1 family hydrophobic/amphiphilic exporter-1
LAETEAVVRAATEILRSRPETKSVFASLGTNSDGQMAIGSVTHAGDPRQANLIVTLVPRRQRRITQQQYEALLRPELEKLPGARVRFGADGQSGSKLEVTLVGEDAAALSAATRELERQMRGLPQLAGARSTASLARPENQNLARFNLPDRQISIRVMLDEQARGDLERLRALKVDGRLGGVPLGSVAELQHGSGPAQIDRLDRVRKATVQAELNGLPLGAATALINNLPILQQLPPGIRQQDVGDAEVMRELFAGFGMALGAGVLMVYLVLVLLFGGFLQPLTIMSALPLSLGGALMALLIAQKSLGVSAVIGVLMLMGIVAKNSILLVEYAILARRERGLDRDEAIMEAARKRARPIVMTTIAMCAGMAHIALGLGADSEFRSPMALVVIGGLITSTLLSLVFVPVAYSYMDGLEQLLARWFHKPAMAALPTPHAHNRPESQKAHLR